MSTQETLEAWAEKNSYIKEGYSGKHYPEFVCHVMNMFDEKSRYCDCQWVAPYGRVISADCPTHE